MFVTPLVEQTLDIPASTPTVEYVGVPETPDVADLTMGVFDLSDTGLTADPAVLVWCTAVAERGFVWSPPR